MRLMTRRLCAAFLLAVAALQMARPEVLVGASLCGRTGAEDASRQDQHASHGAVPAGQPPVSGHDVLAPLDGMDCTHCAPQHCAAHASCSTHQVIAPGFSPDGSLPSGVVRHVHSQPPLISADSSPPTPPPLSSS